VRREHNAADQRYTTRQHEASDRRGRRQATKRTNAGQFLVQFEIETVIESRNGRDTLRHVEARCAVDVGSYAIGVAEATADGVCVDSSAGPGRTSMSGTPL